MARGTISFCNHDMREQYNKEVRINSGSFTISDPLYVLRDGVLGSSIYIYTSKQQAMSTIIRNALFGSSFNNIDRTTLYRAANGVKITRIPIKTRFSIQLDILGHEIVPISDMEPLLRDILDSSKEIQNNFMNTKLTNESQCVFFQKPQDRDKKYGASFNDIAKQPDSVNKAWIHWCMSNPLYPEELPDTVVDSHEVNVFQRVITPKTYNIVLAIKKNFYDTFNGFYQFDNIVINLM